MFRARWRSEKNKIKAVFKLQFQATQIPQSGWETIMVSLVPLDVGKPTVKSEKAVAVDGTCTWEKAIFETVKLSREPKTGKINEKVYRFLISATELPKAKLLGEATFDFAAYAEAVKPFSISLPLKASNASPILHVTVQRMQDDVDVREAEGNGIDRQRKTLQNQLSNSNDNKDENIPNETSSCISTEDGSVLNGQVQQKFPSCRASPHVESNGNIVKSRSFDAISAPGSDSGSERYTPKETWRKTGNINKDPTNFLSPLGNSEVPQKSTTKSSDSITEYGDHRRSTTEWSVSSAPDGSLDGSTNSSEDAGLREGLQGSDVSLEKLKNEVVALARQADVSELELQALRKQVVKERRQGDDLLKELSIVREERNALKRKYELLKASQKDIGIEKVNSLQFDGEDFRTLLKDMKQELNHEKNLNANLHLQLQKTQESNSELILAVSDLEELMEQKRREIDCPNCKKTTAKSTDNGDSFQTKCVDGLSSLQKTEGNIELSETISEHEEDEELEVLATERDDAKADYPLAQKIVDLNVEIELYKKDREDMEMQMEQLALDFEIIKQENHDITSRLEQSQLREQLRMQYECSAHISVINDLEAHVENLEKELEKQAEAFEADLTCITNAKVEQEQRAIQAEETLQKIKWNNVSTAERLQDEFKNLSLQMSTAFDANEKLAMCALTEASELRLQKQHLEELLEKANGELASLHCQYKINLQELLSQIDQKTKEVDQLLLKLKNKSEQLEIQKKSDNAMQRALSEEISKLKVEIEMLSTEKNNLSEQIKHEENLIAEIEQSKRVVKETEILLQDRDKERDVLEMQLISMREEAGKVKEELNSLGHLKDEKEIVIRTLTSDLETCKTQYGGMKHSLFEDELEKENLRKQVLCLRNDLQEKEDAITSLEKKLKDNNARAAVLDGATKTVSKNKGTKSGPALQGSKEIANLREKIKLLEEEIKLKDEALEFLKHSSLRKEMHPGNGNGGLQNGMEEFNLNCSGFCEDNFEEDVKKDLQITGTKKEREDNELLLHYETNGTCISGINGNDKNPTISTASRSKIETLTGYSSQQGNSDELISEMGVLKEKNEAMEAELKEMQERYSEISLKFAEVEGERQQLVMTIRSLRNAMRN